jgi:hypothetical protein
MAAIVRGMRLLVGRPALLISPASYNQPLRRQPSAPTPKPDLSVA